MDIGYVGPAGPARDLVERLAPQHRILSGSDFPLPELARSCAAVFIGAGQSAELQELLFADDGLAAGLAPGKLVVDMTAGDPQPTRTAAAQLAQRGIGMVDAAICDAAELATPTLMVAGADADFELAAPLLHGLGAALRRCGTAAGDGHAMKLVNDAMGITARLCTLEVVAMARKSGLSLPALIELLNKGAARNHATATLLPAILAGNVPTRYRLSRMLRELNDAVTAGSRRGVPMALSSVARGVLQIGVHAAASDGGLDRLVELVATMAAARIAPEQQGAADGADALPALRDVAALKVGYVGLGVMGGELAKSLMRSRPVHVYDTRSDVVREFEQQGAIAAADPASLARACDVIVMCVPTSAVVGEVLFGPQGLAQGLTAGKIVVDQTSGDPLLTRGFAQRLQQQGVAFVDAPVSGGPTGAAAGTIAIMCGGEPQAYAQVRAILASISPNLVYCGGTGNGHLAKLVNNSISAMGRLVTYEGAALGVKLGLPVDALAEPLKEGTAWNTSSRKVLPGLSSRGKATNFQVGLMAKDVRQGTEMGMRSGAPMLVAHVVRTIVENGVNVLGAAARTDDLVELYEQMAGVQFAAAKAA